MQWLQLPASDLGARSQADRGPTGGVTGQRGRAGGALHGSDRAHCERAMRCCWRQAVNQSIHSDCPSLACGRFPRGLMAVPHDRCPSPLPLKNLEPSPVPLKAAPFSAGSQKSLSNSFVSTIASTIVPIYLPAITRWSTLEPLLYQVPRLDHTAQYHHPHILVVVANIYGLGKARTSTSRHCVRLRKLNYGGTMP